jgi:ferredoxin
VSFIPGLGIVKGMALTLRRFFEPKATIRYPEEPARLSAKFRGRLQLLYDEYGTLKCETCFQCAQACPVECIDMGGIDTKARFHVHWGAAETYGERREESALRRAGRTVPDPAYTHFEANDLGPVDEILEEHDYDPGRMLQILEAIQERYGYLPVGALKRIAHRTGAWYAMIYGTASYYRHLRFEPAEDVPQAAALAARRPTEASYLAAFETALAGTARATGGKATGGKTTGGKTSGKGTGDKAGRDGPRRPRTQA